MDKIPCKDCIVFIMCKHRVYESSDQSVLRLANEIKCQQLNDFMVNQQSFNRVRAIFGLPVYDGS